MPGSEAVKRREALLDELRQKPCGLEWCDRHTSMADDVIRGLFARLLTEMNSVPAVAIVATGGYGRRELAPWSDIDLTLVPLDESHPELDQAIKWLFRNIHDAFVEQLGLKVGYALRFAADAPGLDAKTHSSLLDSRVVVGSHDAYENLMRAFWDSLPVSEFIIAKIDERREETERTNDTPLAVQPDLKTGAGGLRSFQAANWIRAAIGERMARPGRPYDTVTKYRNLLHLAAGRAFDQMTYAKRQELADMTGEDPFALGSGLATALESLEGEFTRSIDRLQEARFSLAPHVWAIQGEARVGAKATAGQAAIGLSNATRLSLRVSDLQSEPSAEASAGQALGAIVAGEQTIRNMDRAGVLESLLPELTACRTVMPRDSSHEFTVFEHTLRVVRNLDRLEDDPFLGSLAGGLRDRAPLYLAALLHDVGRSETEEGHPEAGAKAAEKVCERWGVYESTKDTVCWLIREHLTLDRMIRMRDVAHPDTAAELARTVETPARLAMLALLTWADVNAVSAHAWTPAQETFMRELYDRTLAVLGSEEEPAPDAIASRRRLAVQSEGEDISPEEYEAFLDSMPAHYLLSTAAPLAHIHFGLAKRAKCGEISVSLHDVRALGGTDVTVCCLDEPGLLSRILGVLYAFDVSIIAIRASTSSGDTPVALDTITATFGGRPVPRATATGLSAALTRVLAGEQEVDELMRSAGKDPERRQQVFTYKYFDGQPGIVEVQAPRGRGMAYRLSRQLAAHGINIVGARVGQWAGSGTAAFYVLGSGDEQLTSEQVGLALEPQKV